MDSRCNSLFYDEVEKKNRKTKLCLCKIEYDTLVWQLTVDEDTGLKIKNLDKEFC